MLKFQLTPTFNLLKAKNGNNIFDTYLSSPVGYNFTYHFRANEFQNVNSSFVIILLKSFFIFINDRFRNFLQTHGTGHTRQFPIIS